MQRWTGLRLLQWGRAFVGAEIASWSAVWSDSTRLQWGRAFVGAEIEHDKRRPPLRLHASMGPRLCGRGDVLYCWVGNTLYQPLQWGRAFVGAEIRSRRAAVESARALQWGRAFVGAEMRKACTQRDGRGDASMGPRLCGRGDDTSYKVRGALLALLQWGRAFVGAEMRAVHVHACTHARLQWGRAFVGAEILDTNPGHEPWPPLQWGRAFVGAEI